LSVSFNIIANDDNQIVSWEFDAGDGSLVQKVEGSPPVKLSHTYSSADVFTASLTVLDNDGESGSDTTVITVNVENQNQEPTCSINAEPTSGNAPLVVRFSMNADDLDGDIVIWELDVNDDGNPEYRQEGSPPSDQLHMYTSSGVFTARLTVWDNDEATGDDTVVITVNEVNNNQPEKPMTPEGPRGGYTNTEYEYVTRTIDPERDRVKYGWDWDGDENVDEWDDNNGEYYESDVLITTSHSWEMEGRYDIKVIAEDTQAAQSEWSDPFTVEIRRIK
jgi:PKD repeat protein